ncbi:DUF4349 domain-containing protein [Neobacillus notoginsengisoli]|uniref:DUF4349 domain-containing protein n=1 Tax=Neobacillus notoginsengisoli TaxID=1578198 RepID=A0A417YEN1_9BACI|nr:DUF4349 domain-containing protein [Neobacillus notoginsengisoli]RHW31136.1 DUF4349 domain-containing protein [Neobacillus notoginsengisoli]
MMARIKPLFFFFLLVLMASLGACSGDNQSEDAKLSGKADGNSSSRELGNSSGGADSSFEDRGGSDKQVEQNEGEKPKSGDRMVIRQAELHVRVKNFKEAQSMLERKAEQFGGYIVNSTVSRDGDEQLSGNMTIRIPADKFEAFLHEAEGEAAEVLDRVVRGEDVTEQYVDLESRLKSKRAVEARLLEFMKNADKTEDLLKISSDLGAVQEEIEQLTGKIKYFENQASMSTITISFFENKVVAKGTVPSELNTWERTEKQFISSMNFLLSFFSSLIVFLFGNLPVFLTMTAIGFLIFIFLKKVKRRE